jgi:hypothetical protein
MQARLALLLAISVFMTPATAGEEDCPKRFEDYGLFLQAKKACGKEVEYPLMKAMRVCAKQTPQEVAVTLMDGGRRSWARSVMRSSLGSMCEEMFSKQTTTSEHHKRQ